MKVGKRKEQKGTVGRSFGPFEEGIYAYDSNSCQLPSASNAKCVILCEMTSFVSYQSHIQHFCHSVTSKVLKSVKTIRALDGNVFVRRRCSLKLIASTSYTRDVFSNTSVSCVVLCSRPKTRNIRSTKTQLHLTYCI